VNVVTKDDNGSEEKQISRSQSVEESVETDEISASGEDEEDEDDEEIVLSAEEDNLDEDAVEGLNQFVLGLDTSAKRKAGEGAETVDDSRKKRKLIVEQTQTGPENEFAAHTGMFLLSYITAFHSYL
jgi:U3 small nucleolar RNA-associated protein 14